MENVDAMGTVVVSDETRSKVTLGSCSYSDKSKQSDGVQGMSRGKELEFQTLKHVLRKLDKQKQNNSNKGVQPPDMCK